jgi:hypothetical protein
MIPDDDIRIDIGRASDGDFTRMIHIPSGIERQHPGPLKDVNCVELYARWRSEIEDELRSRRSQNKPPSAH